MKKKIWFVIPLLAGLLSSPAATYATISQDYTVHPGDTLYRIANKNGTTVRELLNLNPQIINADKLKVGQLIHLPDVIKDDIALNTIQTAEALVGPTRLTDTSFVYNVLKQNGIYVHTISLQELLKKGTPVEKQALKQGDLLFFNKKEQPDSVSHVAFYRGDGQVIHVSAGQVRIDKLDECKENNYLVRRVIQ
jgi:murein DD-endopeptidase MepM/ murein hydrolase activator NlpD